MLTPSVGNVRVGHHKGRKISILAGPQVCAYAGDQGQSARFALLADSSATTIAGRAHAIDYPLNLTASLVTQFQATGIWGQEDVNTLLAYAHGGTHHCCVFEGALQPRLLDANHFYTALGSGKLSADPFLRFLTDTFCKGNQPKVQDAVFLATWAVQHVIDTNPSGVAGSIRLTTFTPNESGFQAKALQDTEIDEHRQAIESAAEALRD
jgi:hypothetical protein